MKISCVFNLVNGKKTSRSGKCTSPQVKGRTNMYAESMFGMRLIWPLKITSYVDDWIVSFPMHVLEGGGGYGDHLTLYMYYFLVFFNFPWTRVILYHCFSVLYVAPLKNLEPPCTRCDVFNEKWRQTINCLNCDVNLQKLTGEWWYLLNTTTVLTQWLFPHMFTIL